jgi:acetylornithine deacetylase/succinyl-diaminopimelate desuccinylase-like protein
MALTSSPVEFFLSYFEKYRGKLLEDFFSFLRFETIGTDSRFTPQVRACCNWLRHYLEDVGLTTEVWETNGHPVLYSSWLKAGPDKPTVLIYNHYDVQPVDPANLWESAPFVPTIRNGEIFARGAVDNKGQCFFVLTALRALLERDGRLPVNVKLFIEGEEESGSHGSQKVLSDKQEELAADYLFVVDAGMRGPGKPAVTLGCRGITAMTVVLTGSNTDLHSGENGGIVYNPNHALVELLAKIRNDKGRVVIPGFYDDVVPISEEDRAELCFDFDPKEFEALFHAKPSGGENDYSPLESAWLRPTFEINGISGGYTGEGFKTVIPGQTMAKISCRLVPNQIPEKITKLVSDYLAQNVPPGLKIKVTVEGGGGKPVRATTASKGTKAAAEAYAEVCGMPCEYILTGGSIPISAELAEVSGANTVYLGYGLPDDNIHAPNEHFGIDRLKLGTATMGRILEKLGG